MYRLSGRMSDVMRKDIDNETDCQLMVNIPSCLHDSFPKTSHLLSVASLRPRCVLGVGALTMRQTTC